MKPVTQLQLQQVAPQLTAARAAAILPLLQATCTRYAIDTPARLCAFLATIVEESGAFSCKEEALGYSASRICQVWPQRFPTLAAAQPFAHRPQELANKVYAGRLGNGPEASGDGYRFRGSGFIQLTGRALFAAYAGYLGQDTATVTDSLRTNDAEAMDSAGWYFAVCRKVLPQADSGNFTMLTRMVNGGLTNMDLRLRYYTAAKNMDAGNRQQLSGCPHSCACRPGITGITVWRTYRQKPVLSF